MSLDFERRLELIKERLRTISMKLLELSPLINDIIALAPSHEAARKYGWDLREAIDRLIERIDDLIMDADAEIWIHNVVRSIEKEQRF